MGGPDFPKVFMSFGQRVLKHHLPTSRKEHEPPQLQRIARHVELKQSDNAETHGLVASGHIGAMLQYMQYTNNSVIKPASFYEHPLC